MANARVRLMNALTYRLLNARLEDSKINGKYSAIKSIRTIPTFIQEAQNDASIEIGIENTPSGSAITSVKEGLEFLEEIRRFGFSENEFRKALEVVSSNSEFREPVTSEDHARGLVNLYACDSTSQKPEEEWLSVVRLKENLQPAEMNAYVTNWLSDLDLMDVILSEDSQSFEDTEFSQLVNVVKNSPLAIQVKDAVSPMTIRDYQSWGSSGTLAEIGQGKFRLSNGAQLFLLTRAKEGTGTRIYAFRRGGLLSYEEKLRPELASLRGTWVTMPTSLPGHPRLDHVARSSGTSLSMYLDEYGAHSDVQGSSAEDAFRMLNFGMSRRSYREGARPEISQDRGMPTIQGSAKPQLLPLDASRGRLGDSPVDTYLDRFTSAGDYSFVVQSDQTREDVLRLVATYLASLSSHRSAVSAAGSDNPVIAFPSTNQIIVNGPDDVAAYTAFLGGRVKLDTRELAGLRLMREILSIRVNARLREEEGGAYSPTAMLDVYPVFGRSFATYALNVSFVCDGRDLPMMREATREEFEKLARGTIDPKLFGFAKSKLISYLKMQAQDDFERQKKIVVFGQVEDQENMLKQLESIDNDDNFLALRRKLFPDLKVTSDTRMW